MKNCLLFITDDAIFSIKLEKTLIKIIEKCSSKKQITEQLLQQNCDTLKIKSFFPLKMLFKISSKKFNSSILSFYYKTPKIDKINKNYEVFLKEFSAKKIMRKNRENRENYNMNQMFKDWHLSTEVFYLFFPLI